MLLVVYHAIAGYLLNQQLDKVELKATPHCCRNCSLALSMHIALMLCPVMVSWDVFWLIFDTYFILKNQH
jgi:hypothetical protein